MTDLLKKEGFQWLEQAKEPFVTLKSTMTCTLVLALSDFNLPFKLKCDARGKGIRAVLMQRRKNIAFASHVLFGSARGLSTYEKELVFIIEEV